MQQPIQQVAAPPLRTGLAPIVISVQAQQPGKYEHFPSRLAICFGSILIALGTSMVVLNVITLVNGCVLSKLAQGIVAGTLLFFTGVFAILSGENKSSCPIIAMLTLAVIAALATIPAILLHMVGSFPTIIQSDAADIVLRMNMAISALALVSGVLSIVCSTLGCAALCCRKKHPHMAMITIPMNNIVNTADVQYAHQSASPQPVPSSDLPPPYKTTM